MEIRKLQVIPTRVHGAIDQVVGPALVIAPTLLRLGRTSPEGITAEAIGGAQSAYSNLTDYETSIKKLLPLKYHLALDAVGGATLAIVPQLTGARRRGRKHWLPHLAIGAMEIGMAAFTKTEPPRPAERRAQAIKKLAKTALKAKVVKEVAKALA
jgi:hypothetical protein